jgi:hypothetical protein
MDMAVGSLVSPGPSNTEEEVDYLLRILPELVLSLRDQAKPGPRRRELNPPRPAKPAGVSQIPTEGRWAARPRPTRSPRSRP